MLQRAQDLRILLQSKIPLIVLETWQETDALRLLQREEGSFGRPVYRWTITDGLVQLGFGPELDGAGKAQTAEEVLRTVKSRNDAGVFALCDFHPYLDDAPTLVRLLKDIALHAHHSHKTLVFISHRLQLPEDIRPFSSRAALTLPDTAQIQQLIRTEAKRWSDSHGGGRIRTEGRALAALTTQLKGLPAADVSRLAWHAIADDGAITDNDIPALQQAKFSLLNQQGLLSFEFDTEEFADVGGLDNLKLWLQQRRSAFGAAAGAADTPRGVLLLGVQGGGKSLAAKAIAGLWQLPLLRLDMASLYNKFIGETERNLRETLAQAEIMAPCVLWLDELEKALAQSHDDSGLSQRLLGYLLTWMAERKAPVFMVATSNNIGNLPPELVRKGRFDEIFFVDLPDAPVRESIFAIHLSKRGFDPARFNLPQLASASADFSGAEIEQAIVAALYSMANPPAPAALTTHDPLNDGQRSAPIRPDLNTAAIVQELLRTTPLAVVMAEQLQALRQWAAGRTVRA
jgi:hypothetical protein